MPETQDAIQVLEELKGQTLNTPCMLFNKPIADTSEVESVTVVMDRYSDATDRIKGFLDNGYQITNIFIGHDDSIFGEGERARHGVFTVLVKLKNK